MKTSTWQWIASPILRKDISTITAGGHKGQRMASSTQKVVSDFPTRFWGGRESPWPLQCTKNLGKTEMELRFAKTETEFSFSMMTMPWPGPSGRSCRRCEFPYLVFPCIHGSCILISIVDGIFRMKINFYGMQWLQIPCTPVNVCIRLL